MWSYRSAFTSLQNMITNYPSWAHEIARGLNIILVNIVTSLGIVGYVFFILRDIPDSCPMVMENTLKMLGLFLAHWKATLTSESSSKVCWYFCYSISNLLCHILLVCRWAKSFADWPFCIGSILFSSSLGWSIVVTGVLFLPAYNTTVQSKYYERS